MSRTEKIVCDGPSCGADVTEGDGRATRYAAMTETIRVKSGSTLKNVPGVMPQKHFCSEKCVVNFFQKLIPEG